MPGISAGRVQNGNAAPATSVPLTLHGLAGLEAECPMQHHAHLVTVGVVPVLKEQHGVVMSVRIHTAIT